MDYQRIVELWCEQAGKNLQTVKEICSQPHFEKRQLCNDWRSHSNLVNYMDPDANKKFKAYPLADRIADVLQAQIKANNEEWD